MKKKLIPVLLVFTLLLLLLGGGNVLATTDSTSRALDPVVSTSWLAANKNKVVILDVRSADDYKAGHIPNSINIPFDANSAWSTSTDTSLLNLPKDANLFKSLGSCGLSSSSSVVIVSGVAPAPNPPYPLADATRVALTLIYAGVKNVAILDGGYPKWAAEKRETTTKVPVVASRTYKGKVNKNMFVTREYVEQRIGRAIIIDCRDADVYFGVRIEPFANKAGHIPTAKSLPTPWIWEEDGTYRSMDILDLMASGVAGEDKDKEIILYCGAGGYASSWWFLLTQQMGYKNVKFYDGSAQDWVKHNFMIAYLYS